MNESHIRSVLKAISWRVFGTLVTMLFTFAITHKLSLALYIGSFEFISKVFLFYLHERLWGKIPVGKRA
jgi:uncharacterized membrane protein